jgi:mannosyltransferase
MPDGARSVDATVGEGATIVPVARDVATAVAGSAVAGSSVVRSSELGGAARAGRWLLARTWWPGLLVLALGGWELTRPALWPDEFATWGVTRLSWADFVALSRVNDGAIIPYYLFMRAWTDVFGTSELALRLPSLLAMAGTCALVGRLGQRLHSTRVGVVAGLLFALVPAVSRYAQEARVYGLLLLSVVLATLLLDRYVERPSRARLVAYAGAVALVGLAQLLAMLVLAAHGCAVLFAAWRRREAGERAALLRGWVVAAAAGSVPAGALALLVLTQPGQFGWIPPLSWTGVLDNINALFGAGAVAAFVLALALVSRPTARAGVLLAAWALVPTGALLALSVVKPVFWYRYLLFVLPACALLAAIALARLSIARVGAVLAVVAALGWTAQVAMRGPAGHGFGTREIAAVIAAQSRPGDGVAYALPEPSVTWVGRDLVAYYVPADRRPRDVFLAGPQRVDGHNYARECGDLSACLGDPPRLWVVRYGVLADPLAGIGPAKEALLRGRYTPQLVAHRANLTVALLTRRA